MRPEKFSVEVELLWRALPKSARDQILHEAWCVHCGMFAPMCEVTGRARKGDLVLKGRCAFCIRRITLVVPTSRIGMPPN
jgi:hypothetical protein